MSRCYICDWSPDTPSLFNEGIQYTGTNEVADLGLSAPTSANRMLRDRAGKDICSHCASESQDFDPNLQWADFSLVPDFTPANDNEPLEELEEVA